ncbi:hypothetical protein ACMU_08915 [Actibacterium mucosum KCTC 23349]|uniref:FHA domain-containing protein n=1 Tax=Actibacterium mucosum KCTC 23349 TaxID=1454373 RepID=A0A037ZJV0_9RHOB|nr:hypothetical protein [Actibacterium mucosum]KAJ55879.1 hypothetical protein ACMU_08915 [Actibacterium mucosum KCTC 23349]
MAQTDAFALRVVKGPDASREDPLGYNTITVGSGQDDTLKVFETGVQAAHLRIFPDIDSTNPDAVPETWRFAYRPGVEIKNSEGNARFGTIKEGLTFDLGETRLQIVDDTQGPKAKPTREKGELPLGLSLAIIVLVLAVFGAGFWHLKLRPAATSNAPKFVLQMNEFKSDGSRAAARLDECLKAKPHLPPEDIATPRPNLPNFAFLTLHNQVSGGETADPALKSALLNELSSAVHRAGLLYQAGNTAAIINELEAVVNMIPVSPVACDFVEYAYADMTRLTRARN